MHLQLVSLEEIFVAQLKIDGREIPMKAKLRRRDGVAGGSRLRYLLVTDITGYSISLLCSQHGVKCHRCHHWLSGGHLASWDHGKRRRLQKE